MLRIILECSILFSSLTAHCYRAFILTRRTKYPILFFCQVFQHINVFLKDSSFLNKMLKKNLLDTHEWRHFIKYFLFLKCKRSGSHLLILLVIFLTFHILSFIFLILYLNHTLRIVLKWILKLVILNNYNFMPLMEIGT